MKLNQHQTSRTALKVAQRIILLALALWLGVPCLLAQAVPDRLNYQGILLDGQGAPIAMPTDVQFRIWDSPTLTETNRIKWGRMFRITPDTNGAFNVVLSSEGAPLSDSPDVSLYGVFTSAGSDERYLELTVVGSTPIRPRQRFVASPYAMLAHDLTPRQNFMVNNELTVVEKASVGSLTTLGDVTADTFNGNGGGLTNININNLAQALLDQLVPPGTIVAFGGHAVPPPSGWLLCDGSWVSRSTYSRLFSQVGTAWGIGNGSTSFNLPDLRGMFLRGVNGSQNDSVWKDPEAASRPARNGGNAGNNVGSVQSDGLASHYHSLEKNLYQHYRSFQGTTGSDHPLKINDDGGGSIWSTQTAANPGYAGDTRPKNAYVNYIIKY
ncbi:MAG TPA: tail fiber protein [Candidatus Paceibacterota bacterium]|nr:tail fiber protein [Verrucomicrobiota bacterium]HSA13028.1 tail fiber protein [Candidatus Paceibacterota bacterium]